MTGNEDQPKLWSDDEIQKLREQLERAREEWQKVRRRHAVGSRQEKRAWKVYRDASDRLWGQLDCKK